MKCLSVASRPAASLAQRRESAVTAKQAVITDGITGNIGAKVTDEPPQKSF